MATFHHDRLIVYRKSVEFVALAAQLIPTIQPTYGFLRDQLGRAATSIALNIAQGSGEFSRPEKARFYGMARRSAAESATILEALEALGSTQREAIASGRGLLNEMMAMLTVMTRPEGPAPRGGSTRTGA